MSCRSCRFSNTTFFLDFISRQTSRKPGGFLASLVADGFIAADVDSQSQYSKPGHVCEHGLAQFDYEYSRHCLWEVRSRSRSMSSGKLTAPGDGGAWRGAVLIRPSQIVTRIGGVLVHKILKSVCWRVPRWPGLVFVKKSNGARATSALETLQNFYG
jgi:hypothetical protein